MVGLKEIVRKFLPNPLDVILKEARRFNKKRFLLAWNRGLGDIPLGLFAIVLRIREFVSDAHITFIIRENLKEGFLLLEGVDELLIAKHWKRHYPYNVKDSLKELQIDEKIFDVIIDWPDPNYWVKWQRGKITPRLKWDTKYDSLYEKFDLTKNGDYIGVQPFVESGYLFWRDWPKQRWDELFEQLEKDQKKVILFGFSKEQVFSQKNVVDLRGETSVLEALSIIKNCCSKVVFPDSGLLSMIYYLDLNFPIKVVSIFGAKKYGILLQGVDSPNEKLTHFPIIKENKDVSTISAYEVLYLL